MYALLLALALSAPAATNVTVYKVSPALTVIGEDRGQLVQNECVAGECIVAYIPERIFANGFEQ